MEDLSLKQISRQNFNQILKKKGTEDLDVIKHIDNLFIKKRGYVFKQPQKGEKVILLLSGGIDSTVAWETLIKVYNYQVYPLIIDRGQAKRVKKELSATRSLEKYFAKKYPSNYVKPFHLEVNTTPKEARELVIKKNVLPEDILLNFHQNINFIDNHANVIISRTNGITPYLMPFYGVFYANYLEKIKDIGIKDIFVGINFSDGHAVSSQSFTALRTTLLAICSATADYKWNFSSVFLERETGVMLDKVDTIKLGHQLGIPLSKTWSCYRHKLFQCGDACATCVDRRKCFKQAGIADKTLYMSDIKKCIFDIKNRVLNSLKFHFKNLKCFFSF